MNTNEGLEKDNAISNNFIPAANIIYEESFERDLAKLGDAFRFFKISTNFGILFVDSKKLYEFSKILDIKSAQRIEPNVRLGTLSTISKGTYDGIVATEDIGAGFLKDNTNLQITGKDVLIGIVDSGIDYLHPDFIYQDNTSKILYLWDQTKEGKPPNEFFIGSEYTKEDINKAIKEKDATLSVDNEGTGTALSGICAGLGNENREYRGVAEGSELIVVKLKKINNDYNNGTLFAAVQYLYKKAKQLNKPIINNVSQGNSMLVGITSLITDRNLFYEQGVCQVVAVGNEGNSQNHTSGKINFNGETKDIELDVGDDEKELNIEFWVNRPDKIDLSIVSPSGDKSKVASVSNYNIVQGLFNLENTTYTISYSYPFSYSGQQRTVINLSNVKKGIWKIRLTGSYITNGIYQIYLENRQFLSKETRFRESNPMYTINYPSTYDDAISVGAIDTINNNLWSKSSRGPTIESILKPDIVAPGVNIIAPAVGGGYSRITGTGAAAAYVSGAVSLFMQYVLVDGKYENKSFSQKIRTYLRIGAKRNKDIPYPNNNYGYGELDIKGVFEQLR